VVKKEEEPPKTIDEAIDWMFKEFGMVEEVEDEEEIDP
jgi:pyrroline-5-carboxylate reductase